MRIAYFSESLPPKTDGVSHTLSRLAETLLQQGIEFHFYSTVKPEPAISWRNRVTTFKSVPIPMYDYYRIAIPGYEQIKSELDRFQPDLIHCTTPTPMGFHGVKYARANGIPAVSSYHTHFVSYFRYYGYELLEQMGWSLLRRFHNKFEATYVPTANVAAELQQLEFVNLQVWRRGIELQKFSPELRAPELRKQIGAENLPILLFVGRLVKEKDLDDLVEAQEILKNKGHRFKVVIVGDGPMREELQGKMPDAHFTGFIYGRELATWYASSDLLAFPSTTETFGNVIQEAFASGIPAVCVEKGGVVDLIRDGVNGFLAEPNSPTDFANKLETLLRHVNLRKQMGRQARALVKEHTWDNINQELLQSYGRVIEGFQARVRS